MAFEFSAAAPGRQEAESVSPFFFPARGGVVRPLRGTSRSCKMACFFDPLEGSQLCFTEA